MSEPADTASSSLPAFAWADVWVDVARQLAAHRAEGRGHLLTEDTVRLCTVMSLERLGVSPSDLTIEVLDPVLRGGKVDLVVRQPAGRTVVELKYPRGSRTGISPDTMTLGELLRDFLRVAVLPAAERWVTIVLEPELRRYLSRREALTWADKPGQELVLERDALEALPKTARDAIGTTLAWLLPVRATCAVAAAVDVDLALFAYRVQAPPAGAIATPLAVPTPSTVTPGGGAAERSSAAWVQGQPSAPKPGSARAEILNAIKTLITRSGDGDVTVQEVVDEMRRRGSRYAESTVRTMMTSHMCAQVHGPNIAAYDDLDRVARGAYRVRSRPDVR